MFRIFSQRSGRGIRRLPVGRQNQIWPQDWAKVSPAYRRYIKIRPAFWNLLKFLILGRLCKNGTRQSPVNLHGCDAHSAPGGKPLKVDKFSNRTAVFKLFNTGYLGKFSTGSSKSRFIWINWFPYTAQVNVLNEEGAPMPMSISGGPLDGVYNLLNMNFNWAATDEDGSLHAMRGK